MKRSVSRILTTHTGSLPRPADLVAMLNAKELGEPYDKAAFAARVRRAVADVVRRQVDTGIDVVGDGEHGKFNWMAYARARLDGLSEIESPVRFRTATRNSIEFADAYEDLKVMHAARSLVAKRTARPKALVCAGPIKYVGQDELRFDLDNLKSALQGQRHEEAFVTAISPSNLELYYENQYYPSDEEYFAALSDAMRVEYLAIVEAGFVLQIDDPRMATHYNRAVKATIDDCRKFIAIAGRGAEPCAARHSRGQDPVPHLLQHQYRTARTRLRAEALRRSHAAGPRSGLRDRGRQSAP